MTQQGSSLANGTQTPAQPSLPLQQPRPAQPRPAPQAIPHANYTGAISAAIDIVSTRSLGLLSVVGAVAMFGYAVVDPMPWRTYTVGLYAAVVLWPLVYLYLRKD